MSLPSISDDDLERLHHMYEAAGAAQRFLIGLDTSFLDSNLQIQYSVVRALEIIGEAANKVSKQFREDHPSIDWSGMIGMRNILIHDYNAIDSLVVWNTVFNDLPILMAELRKILYPPLPDQE